MTDERSPPSLADVAATATIPAGELLIDEFRTGHVTGEYGPNDVKTDVDDRAERLVLDVLDDRVPSHATHGEETGTRGDGAYTWVIDPLDGTNNFVAGFPSFATATCCLHDDEPVATAVYEPLPGSLYVAARDAGTHVVEGDELDELVASVRPDTTHRETLAVGLADADPAGRALAADSDTPLEHGTVSYVVGLPAIRDPELRARSDRIADAIGSTCKRVLQSWSPCVDWGLLARGGTEAVVCFRPDPYEQYAGSLLAEEAGAAVRESEGVYVAAADADVAERLHDLAAERRS
ncbi:inositol monophosphatase family protein [Halorubrum sp. DTA98]|uniref:inositol monophosphatase family protein n=1 Tax=Halorubrum sp. DTA98 TaxID=3402163 RepID=UPI003AAACB95